MDCYIDKLRNDYIFLNVINYCAAHLQQLIAASLLNADTSGHLLMFVCFGLSKVSVIATYMYDIKYCLFP